VIYIQFLSQPSTSVLTALTIFTLRITVLSVVQKVLRSDFISPVINKLPLLLEVEDIGSINYENHAFKQVLSFTLSPLSSVAVG